MSPCRLLELGHSAVISGRAIVASLPDDRWRKGIMQPGGPHRVPLHPGIVAWPPAWITLGPSARLLPLPATPDFSRRPAREIAPSTAIYHWSLDWATQNARLQLLDAIQVSHSWLIPRSLATGHLGCWAHLRTDRMSSLIRPVSCPSLPKELFCFFHFSFHIISSSTG